jgi:hypothetical protein
MAPAARTGVSRASYRSIRVKVEGRKSYDEIDLEMVRLAKRLHRYPANGKRRSLRDVSGALAQAGFKTGTGKPFTAEAVSRMVRQSSGRS